MSERKAKLRQLRLKVSLTQSDHHRRVLERRIQRMQDRAANNERRIVVFEAKDIDLPDS